MTLTLIGKIIIHFDCGYYGDNMREDQIEKGIRAIYREWYGAEAEATTTYAAMVERLEQRMWEEREGLGPGRPWLG